MEMSRFYINKYPISYSTTEGQKRFPIGTSFIIIGVGISGFELEPVEKVKGFDYPLQFGMDILEAAFTGQGHINNNTFSPRRTTPISPALCLGISSCVLVKWGR